MGLPIWGDLDRAVNDATKIDEAIATAIAAHNSDSESHLGADESLETHRGSDIIDHPAESVVNDKIKPLARAYVAIVDPTSEHDYDTIDAAWTYAASIGGGNILITPGTHYIGSILQVDGSINLFGTDPDTCIVVTDFANNFYFETGYWAADWAGSFEFSNLTLRATTAGFFVPKTGIDKGRSSLLINNSILEGAGGYSLDAVFRPTIENSRIILSATAAISSKSGATLRNVDLDTVAASGVIKFIDPTPDFEIQYWTLDGVRCLNFLEWASGVRLNFAGGALFIWSSFKDCDFRQLDTQTIDFDTGALIACTILPASGEQLDFNFAGAVAVGCYFGTAGTTWINFNGGIYVGCFMGLTPAVVGTSSKIVAPAGFNSYTQAGAAQTVFNYTTAKVYQKTPNATQTYTATVPQAGEQRTMIILTSGATSYTITFGSGFKTTGTLATGTTTARRFVIEFISDGTNLIETSRTVAIA